MAGFDSSDSLTAVLPGTHSKWIRMDGDTIRYFSTFMTGELFAAITQHTILGRLMTKGDNEEGFARGVRDGFSSSEKEGGILSKLFGARALPLLEMMHPDASEATTIRTYLDWLLDVPWRKSTKDRLDLKIAKQVLDEDHYGLDKIKERILEYLAVRKLNKSTKGPILCFVGPPGTGRCQPIRSFRCRSGDPAY